MRAAPRRGMLRQSAILSESRLTTRDLEQLINIAGRSPQIYPPGAYAALKEERDRRSMQRSAARSPDARISPGAARTRKTRERKRKNLRLATIEVSLNAYEAAKRGDFSGIIPVLNAWERFEVLTRPFLPVSVLPSCS